MLPTKEETRLWIAFNLAHRRVHREMERALAADDLPPLKTYDVLWAVEMAGDDGVRARNLKDWILFEQSNLSRVLQSLVERDLVRETVCSADRRAKILNITTEGAKLRKKMWSIYGEQIHIHMKALNASEHSNAFLHVLEALQCQDVWSGGKSGQL